MATLYTHKDSNIAKTWVLMITFLIVIIALGWFFGYVLNEPAILYLAVLIAIIMNITSYWYSDKIVVRISGAKPADLNEYKELHRVVENLAITAGLPKPRVYVILDSSPNAFATGRDPAHAVVAVTTGLLNILDRTELEGVIAHELSHIGNRDILVSTVAVVLVGFVVLISDFFLRFSFLGGGRGGDNGGQARGVLVLVGIVLAILAPIVAMLMQLAISRKREFLADASGALLTRYPEGLASALAKISQTELPLKKANHATAHLYISDPYASKKTGLLTKMFQTHPPVGERIAVLADTR